MEKIQPTRKQIIDDVRLWSKHFLEVPNLHLGGVPACPFAKKAWLDKKVWVSVKSKYIPYKKELNNCLKNLDFPLQKFLYFVILTLVILLMSFIQLPKNIIKIIIKKTCFL